MKFYSGGRYKVGSSRHQELHGSASGLVPCINKPKCHIRNWFWDVNQGVIKLHNTVADSKQSSALSLQSVMDKQLYSYYLKLSTISTTVN